MVRALAGTVVWLLLESSLVCCGTAKLTRSVSRCTIAIGRALIIPNTPLLEVDVGRHPQDTKLNEKQLVRSVVLFGQPINDTGLRWFTVM